MMDQKRILWGVALAVLVVGIVFFAPLPVFKLVIVTVVGLCLREFMNMALPKHPTSAPNLGILLGIFLSGILLFAKGGSELWIGSLSLIVIITFVFYLFSDHDLTLVLPQIALTIFGCIYVAGLFSYSGLLRGLGHGIFWVFLLAATTFMADTGAYFVGHLLGRHKLAPKVSPGKTVEGLIGGIAGSVAAAFIVRAIFWRDFRVSDCWMLGILVGLIGPMGDLSESLIKRSVGVKDSGQLIPGHGGLLDRLDALLFTAPLVYYYAVFFY